MEKKPRPRRAPSVAIIGTRGYPSYYGGFETAVRKLAPFLADKGWDVTVYGRKNVKSDDAQRDVRVRSVTTIGIENKSLSTLSFGLTSCLHAMWKRPDVALVMNVANGFWLPLLALRGIPTVINVDGIEWERAKWGRLAKRMFFLGAKMSARFGNTLVADSKEIARRWEQDFSRSSVFIPYGGEPGTAASDVDDFPPRNYVLAVARFVPENTIPEFLEAASEIASDYDVVIVGSSGYGGPLEEAVQRLVDANSNVHWLGHISDDQRLLALWKNCGAYFHGHSVGGTNPALVQAMANGAPTVARDTVYNREVLGGAGVFCDPNPQSIKTAVRRVMDSPQLQQELSAASLLRVEDGYTWEAVCRSYEETLRARTGYKAKAVVNPVSILRYAGLTHGANVLASAQMYVKLAPMLIRGVLRKPWLKKSDGFLFVGRGARLKNPQFISHTGRLVIEDFAEVQGLASQGLNFGADVSIGPGTQIRPSSYYGGEVGVGLWVGDRSSFGTGCFIGCSGEIRIGDDVMIGPGVRLFSENHEFEDKSRTIKSQGVVREFLIIGDNTWVGSGATIMAGVTVGPGSVIAAGSVVTRDVPANSVVAGVPAKVLRAR